MSADGRAADPVIEAPADRAVVWPEATRPETPSASLRLSGPLLSAAQWLSKMPASAPAVRVAAREMLGLGALARLPEAFRGSPPDDPRPRRARPPRRWDDARHAASRAGDGPADLQQYRDAYASSRATPEGVATAALEALMSLSRRSPRMNVLAACDPEQVARDARSSAERIANGTARLLEGVPFLAKDQHDVAGLPTRFGSRGARGVVSADATQIGRLRAAGAVVLGKSVMTEWGISPIGTNVHVDLPRNPHAPAHVAGGSSTGSAVAVALGAGPFATGGDAGGSVRVPAAWSGIFGLKPTFGRISRSGEAAWGSLNHVGVLAVRPADLASVLDVVASAPDPEDPFTLAAEPPPHGGFGGRLGDGVRGLRIGIDETEWQDCTAEISKLSRAALAALERDGATLVPVRIPLARYASALGIATIGCEGVALAESAEPHERDHLAVDIRLALNVAAGVSGAEYLQVQRLRMGLRRQLSAAFASVDVLALPVVPVTAPRLSQASYGQVFSDATLVTSLCRHTFLANLSGLPAASAPIGADRHGVPVGLQLVADAWDEAGLLAVLAHLERAGVSVVRTVAGALKLV